MEKVEIYQRENADDAGLAIKINDKTASLQDLLDAWQPLCDDGTVYKSYASGYYAPCRGCLQNCCQTAYVMPDLIAFKKMAAHLKLDYEPFINAYFDDEKVRSGLLKLKSNPCIFLQQNICTIYPWRSLICRFYICTPLTGATEQFIYSIAWTGTAAALLLTGRPTRQPVHDAPVLSSMDQLFINLLEKTRESPNINLFFRARDYCDIPLLPFIDDYTGEILADASWRSGP